MAPKRWLYSFDIGRVVIQTFVVRLQLYHFPVCSAMYSIQIARTEADLLKCWPALHLLRPHLDEHRLLPLLHDMMQQGYELAFIESPVKDLAAAVIGFRHQQKLHDGKQIYIDDLTTLEEYRGQGYAGALLDYVFSRAEEEGCWCVTLDSGPQRHAAHRLYLNKGFDITSYHFTRKNADR